MDGTEWFWRVVDANGLGDVPSDEVPALRLLCERAARTQELEAENARLRTLAENVANAQAVYAYAEPNFGVLLTLKEKARAALATDAPGT